MIYDERIARGMQLLDERLPGWEQKIDLETLDIANSRCCVVSQSFDDGRAYGRAYGKYTHGLLQLFPDGPAMDIDFGFFTQSNEAHLLPALTAAWKRAITARREAAGAGATS